MPCVEIFGYYGRRRLSKDGNVDKYKLTHYPDFGVQHVNYFGDGKNCLNPERLLPANRFHLRLGSSNAKGLVVRLNGIPQELILCFGFLETFLGIFSSFVTGQESASCHTSGVGEPHWLDAVKSHASKVESPKFHTSGVGEMPYLGEMLELLQRFLITTTSSPLLREMVFHILAQVLRLLARTTAADRLQVYFDASASFLASLKSELFKLMEKEVSVSRANALEYVLNCNFEKVKFSSYLQSLLDVVLAAVEVQRRVKVDGGDSPRQRGTLWDIPCEDSGDQTTAQVRCCKVLLVRMMDLPQ